jgi:hypothetical protein
MSEISRRLKFRTSINNTKRPNDPESLFSDLKVRGQSVRHLWAHQADILRDYNKNFINRENVAFELPTGTGKTLIGLLIGEFRRRKFEERVIYLCPTRQLVNQVGSQALEYGISAKVILKPEYDYFNEYQAGNNIAITTYSSLFNTNPRFSDPHTIIMDDAHSSENYIASLWTVCINRREYSDLYKSILNLFKGSLESSFLSGMLDDDYDDNANGGVEMLPLPKFYNLICGISDLLNDRNFQNEKFRYPWSMILDKLHCCNIFISWSDILIRPMIPPTNIYEPFIRAKQRILISATLGESGELERITGLPNIDRIPLPDGWEKQSSGRRLFLFPNLSLKDAEINAFQIDAIRLFNKALLLVPKSSDLERSEKIFSDSRIVFLKPSDIEDTLESFVNNQSDTVLGLANRYDGIDLPDDSCRLVVMEDIPAGVNLQERFYLERLGTSFLFRDRIRTRFTQGVGRCCRNSNDYSAILILGQKLLDFILKRENRAGIHPELQAELKFGIDNSKDLSLDDFISYLTIFKEREVEWNEAEKEIQKQKMEISKETDDISEILKNLASREIRFIQTLWVKNYYDALNIAKEISDMINMKDAFGYKAIWLYYAGCAAWLLFKENKQMDYSETAKKLFQQAAKYSDKISWFNSLISEIKGSGDIPSDSNYTIIFENVFKQLENLGFEGPKFDKRINDIKESIFKVEHNHFENGLKDLGNLLGYISERPNSDGSPDGIWIIGDMIAFAFEAKSEELKESSISLSSIREMNTHANWLRNYKQRLLSNLEIATILITPRYKIDNQAKQNAKGYYLNIDNIRRLANSTFDTLRRIRAQIASNQSNREAALDIIKNEFQASKLLPNEIISLLKKDMLVSLPE